jgi:hypothetical protein
MFPIRAELQRLLGDAVVTALDASLWGCTRAAWEQHADGTVCADVTPAGGMAVAWRGTRSQQPPAAAGAGARLAETLTVALVPAGALTPAELLDWPLGAAWSFPGHDCSGLREPSGRCVYVVAPPAVSGLLAAYVAYALASLSGQLFDFSQSVV